MRQHPFLLATLLSLLSFRYLPAATLVLDPSAPADAQVSVISESRGEIVLELRFGAINVDSEGVGGETWTRLSIPGTTPASQSGRPELPQKSVWVRLTGENPRVDVIEANTVRRFFGKALPAAEPLYRSDHSVLRRVADAEFYGGTRIFPVNPVEISLSGELVRARVALITFSPVQYRPGSQEWVVHTCLRVRVTGRGASHLDQVTTVSAAARSLYERIIINPAATQDSSISGNTRMLLVTVPEYVPVLQPFVAWKMQSGVPVRMISYPQVAADAAALRTYIRGLCDSLVPPPEFLLLVGDVNIIPPFFGVSSSLTDHPYSLLDDNDYLPDLSVGRIPCQSVSDCADWVARLLSYERDAVETTPMAATVFSSSAALDPLHGIDIRSLFQSAGLAVDHFQEPQTGTLTNLTSSLNAGKSWIFYIGHGYAQAWSSVYPAFTNTEIAQLTTEISPITISVACATADLDYPGLSLAEFWLSRPGAHGPLVYFGATESTAFFRSDTLGIGTLRAVFQQQCERIGTAADLGRLATAQYFPQPPGGLTEETIQQFILLGDPSMRVFSVVPQPLTVSCPASVPLAANELQFTVRKNAVVIANADVCVISEPPGFYALQRTDQFGIATVPIDFSAPTALHWTVTARNAIPASGVINIVPDSGAFLQVVAVQVRDTAGDGDGNADRAESCELLISIRNSGTAPSLAGVARVSCSDPNVEIVSQMIPFSTIPVGEQLWLSSAVPMVVPDSVNEGETVILEILIRTEGGDSSLTLRPLMLHAPHMVFLGSALREDSGDGDGLPEGGERLSLLMKFRNDGEEDLRMPACSLFSFPVSVQLQSVNTLTDTCAPGDTLQVTALLHVMPNVPRGLPLEYAYSLSATNLASQTGWDLQRIGQVPVYLYVLDVMPQQVDGIAAALTSLGVEYERGATLPADLFRYTSVWIFCGVYPNAVALPTGYANLLMQYLNGGGRCFWEGGDVWAFDPRTNLHSFFHIRGTNDGTSNAGPVNGEYGTAYADYRFQYAGENSFIDQIQPETGALIMLRNAHASADFPLCIAYAGANYRTVGSSIELGSLADSTFPSTRVHLVNGILRWFGIESRADIYPPVIQHVPLNEFLQCNRPIEILADVQDASGLDSVVLEYRIGSNPCQQTEMALSDGIYRGWLPGAAFGAVIHYRIRATDASSHHNIAVTGEYSVRIVTFPDMPMSLTPNLATFAGIRPRINPGDGGSWALIYYPEDVPVLELHGGRDSVTFTTEKFDCSRLQTVALSFWHYLRQVEPAPSLLASVVGSTDGGRTFPHWIWKFTSGQGGSLEEGDIVIPDLKWAAGEPRVVFRFNFFGDWYWRLRDVYVSGRTAPVTSSVGRVVISVTPQGMQLAWPSVRDALHYVVLAAPSLDSESGFLSIAQIRDTVFVDRDDSFTARYYQVEAVLEESTIPFSDRPQSTRVSNAELRLLDLRWNVKLGSAASH